ncbi:MAG: DUF4336 domain-containing protein [Pseudomonadota bacterium]
MTQTLTTAENCLTEVVRDIWTVDGPYVQYSLGPLTIQCPTRMTIIRNQRAELLVHSPIAPHDDMSNALAELGTVSAILVPNSFHYLFLGPWLDRYPDGKLYVPHRLPKNIDMKDRPARPVAELADGWSEVVSIEEVDAGDWSEVSILHNPSRTLILTDLMQNFQPSEYRNPIIRALLRIGGAARTYPTASLEMRLPVFMRGRRKHVRKSFDTIKSWQPSRILIAHGPQPRGDTAVLLEKAFAWV